MRNRRDPGRGKEPVEDGLLLLLKETPVEVVACTQRLVLSGRAVRGTTMYPPIEAATYDALDMLTGLCMVIRRQPADADAILKLLTRFDCPHVLKPGGAWQTFGDLVFMTFPLVDGTLDQIEQSKLFNVEEAEGKILLHGFTKAGLKAFRDLVNSVHHVNRRAYTNESAGTSSSDDESAPPPLRPLKLSADRVFYQKLDATDEYHVLIGDFYTSIDINPRRRLNAGVEALIVYNWNSLGLYLDTIMGCGEANEELKQLAITLKSSSVTYDDILWEPALCGSVTKMYFIREVYFCIEMDSSGNRKLALQKLSSLGLQSFINILGETYNEKDFLGSVFFLRNKIVAHHDGIWKVYGGSKSQDVGIKETLEQFLLRNKPKYMIDLIKVIRPLKWIQESPLQRSRTCYMQVLKPI